MSALLRSWAVEGIGVRRKFATRESIRNRQVAAATAPPDTRVYSRLPRRSLGEGG